MKIFRISSLIGCAIHFSLLAGCAEPVKTVQNDASTFQKSAHLENPRQWNSSDFETSIADEFTTSRMVRGPLLYAVEREGAGIMVIYSLLAQSNKSSESPLTHVVMVSIKYYSERRQDFSNATLSGGDRLRIQDGGSDVKCSGQLCEFSRMFAIHIPSEVIDAQEDTRIRVSSTNAMDNRNFVLQIPVEYKNAYREKISMDLAR